MAVDFDGEEDHVARFDALECRVVEHLLPHAVPVLMLLELACLIRLAAVAIVSQRFRLRALQRLTFAPSTLLMETPAPAAAAAAKSARDMPGVTVMAAPRAMLRPSVPRRVTPTSVSSEQRVANGEGWTMGFMAVSKDMIIHSPPVLNLRSVSYAGHQWFSNRTYRYVML